MHGLFYDNKMQWRKLRNIRVKQNFNFRFYLDWVCFCLRPKLEQTHLEGTGTVTHRCNSVKTIWCRALTVVDASQVPYQ